MAFQHVDDLSLWQLQQTCRLFRNSINEDENLWHERYLQRFSQSSVPQLDTADNLLQLNKHKQADVSEVQALWSCSWRDLFAWRQASFLQTGNGDLLLKLKGDNREECIMQDLRSLSKASPLHGGTFRLRHNVLNRVPLGWQMKRKQWIEEVKKKEEEEKEKESQLWKRLLENRFVRGLQVGDKPRSGSIPARLVLLCEQRLRVYPEGKEKDEQQAEEALSPDREVLWFFQKERNEFVAGLATCCGCLGIGNRIFGDLTGVDGAATDHRSLHYNGQ